MYMLKLVCPKSVYRCRKVENRYTLFQPLTNYSTSKAKTCQCSGKNLIY